ncbi:MAG: GntR family transcriptional regulator [Actinomycetota bacterium]|nr:GntR family transcriptional regulator [Actinomycetota bacterium]
MLHLGQVDKAADAPSFRQIAGQLREAIRRGDLTAGDRLPSETQLVDHYGVARMTVRQALGELRAEGLVVAEHGRGVFVRNRPPVRRLASDRFARRHRDQGKAAFLAETEGLGIASVDQVEVQEVTPPPRAKELLALQGRVRVVARSRRYLLDGLPVELAVSYVPVDIARGTRISEPDPGPGGIYARLEELGLRLSHFTEEVSSRMPTPEERRRLTLSAGTPVLLVLRTAYDISGRAVEVCDTVKAATSYVLEYSFPAE